MMMMTLNENEKTWKKTTNKTLERDRDTRVDSTTPKLILKGKREREREREIIIKRFENDFWN